MNGISKHQDSRPPPAGGGAVAGVRKPLAMVRIRQKITERSGELPEAQQMKMTLTYIFHSGFVLETDRAILVFDYWLDPSRVMPPMPKAPATLPRFTEPPLPPP